MLAVDVSLALAAVVEAAEVVLAVVEEELLEGRSIAQGLGGTDDLEN